MNECQIFLFLYISFALLIRRNSIYIKIEAKNYFI